MRASTVYALLLSIALVVSGCSAAQGASGSQSTMPTAAVAGATPVPAPTVAPTAAPAATTADPAATAIQAVIQKANQEQQDAFAKGDPTVMKDTATSSYYNELVQINNDMANGGVSAIKLVKIEWGQIKLDSPTAAQTTTYETWSTTYSDGSTDQSREQNVYALVQEQGAWKIQSDDHPTSGQGGAGGSPASGSTRPGAPSAPPTPASPAPSTPANSADMSRNWSGYAATSGTFTAVTGTWTIPQAQSSAGLSSDATWVGIGGVQSRDLIQAGTEATATRSGTVNYDAWIEMLPQPSRPIRLAVKPGDSVTVSISEQSSNQWLIQFENHTTGETYQTTVQYASTRSSAEWIEEAPSVGRRIVPIGDFGTVQFSGGTAVQNGKTATISQAGAQPITMTDTSGQALVRPSVLTPDGQGFSVTQATP